MVGGDNSDFRLCGSGQKSARSDQEEHQSRRQGLAVSTFARQPLASARWSKTFLEPRDESSSAMRLGHADFESGASPRLPSEGFILRWDETKP